jgi:trans-aconitate 2-methyltransferase
MNILLLCFCMFSSTLLFGEPENSLSFEFNDVQVKNYNEKPSNHQEEILKIIESGVFRDSKKVLDVGCGDGKLTAFFASNLPHAHIVGCDVSPSMIEYALGHYVGPNLNFIVKNAENLDFEDQFDTVVSFNCLHWIKNQKRAIEQISNILKPNGKIFLVATPNSSNNDFKTICRDIILSFRWIFYFIGFQSVHSFHTETEYGEILTSCGFLIDKIETKQTEMVFRDENELEPFLKAVLTPLQHLNPIYHSAFLADFYQGLDRLGRIYPDGSIHLFFDQIELQAHKKPSALQL